MSQKIIISTSVILLLSVTGCKKFLDKEPDDRAKLNTPEKVSQLLATAYPQTNYQPMTEMSSDNVGDRTKNEVEQPSWNTLLSDYFSYKDNLGVDEDSPDTYWFACYHAIAVANQALDVISKVTDTANYQAQKGEALVARAYAHFMLVNLYSKFYNKTTASTDIGIPYVTEPETISIKKYDRKTVQYVYDMVEKDMLAGLSLIKDESYTIPKYHFTKSAAYAFACRYYLYKWDFDNVVKYARLSLNENNFTAVLRPWNTTYAALPLNGNGSLGQIYSKATEPANLLLVETQSWWLYLIGLGKYGFTTDLNKALIGNSTLVPASSGTWVYRTAYFSSSQLPFIPKIDLNFVETSIGSGIGNGWQMVPLFTAEEVLFNLAEAYTYQGQTTKAITLLNTYLSTRIDTYTAAYNISETSIKSYYGVTDIKQGLINTILDYRRIEYIHEGMRWFDILRYGIEIKHYKLDPAGINIVDSVVLDKNNPHRVFQIPATAVAQAGLVANPR